MLKFNRPYLAQSGEPAATISARVTEAARMLGLTNLPDRRPSQLSGAQRQRVPWVVQASTH
ncbi:hypothetical protein [Phyllobacterium ifriqiyense]|uniref:hypothetical protein n=1 Tax=Phyllobacterium ifriqiyense TaxID=314238 RepID=UPI00348C2F7F